MRALRAQRPLLLRACLLTLFVLATVTCGGPIATVPEPADPARGPTAVEPMLEAPVVPPVPVVEPGPVARLAPMGHVWQTLNNCGPAAVVMALSTLGFQASQEEARLALRGDDVRRGMPATGVDPWVNAKFGLRAIVRTNGSVESVKRLVANGFPVIVTQWLEDGSRIAHYRVVRGYDDRRGAFQVNDSMRGTDVALDYGWFSANWQPFLYRYLIVYRPADEDRLRALLGADWNVLRAREHMYQRAKHEAAGSASAYAWLAYGEAAYQYGRFAEAVEAFERGMALGSPNGVFSVRSSYPLSLQLIGREADARAARERLARITPVPARAVEPDPIALELAPGPPLSSELVE
jgi:hypothetical protein